MSDTVESDDGSVLKKIVDESMQSSTENTINDSLFINPIKVKNQHRIIVDSSEESDIGQTPSNNFISKVSFLNIQINLQIIVIII